MGIKKMKVANKQKNVEQNIQKQTSFINLRTIFKWPTTIVRQPLNQYR